MNSPRFFWLFICFILITGGVFFTLALTGCDINTDNTGYITINLGANPRSSLPWPPQDYGILEKLEYKIVLSGNGGRIEFSAKGGETINRSVASGFWNIQIDAYLDKEHYATGKNTVDVKPGRFNQVTVTMSQVFYDDCNDCGECEICKPDTGCNDCGVCEICKPDTDCNDCGECDVCDPDIGCNDCGECEICDPDFNFTFNVSNEAQWLEARAAIAAGGNGKNYIINITGNFSLPGDTDTNDWDTFGTVTGITILIRGTYTITLNSEGWFMVINSGQTVVMRDLNLKGFSSNLDSVVYVDGLHGKSEFIMEGIASVSGNNLWGDGGGVNVFGSLASFTMRDNAKVYDNSAVRGGGVFVSRGATFIMRDNARVHNNSAEYGGGVHIGTPEWYSIGASFIMQGSSSVDLNSAAATSSGSGGGVYVESGETFTRSDNASVTNNSSAGTGQNIGPYEIGDTGPGGGIVFYADYAGFTVQGTGSGNTGAWPDSYRAHYLEADTGTINLTWAPITSPANNIVEGTSLDIGTGRRNTALILAAAGANPATDAPAANFCVNYGTPGDWFLPSYYEILELTHYMINYSPGDIVINDTHWTSSQGASPIAAEQHSLGNTTMYGNLVKQAEAKVRPIRAF